jgi:hypothetical protein
VDWWGDPDELGEGDLKEPLRRGERV